MSTIQERYRARPMAANSTYTLPQGINAIGGFIATADGVINVYDEKNVNVVVNLPVTSGVYYPLPIYLGMSGSNSRVVLSSNAAGTILTS